MVRGWFEILERVPRKSDLYKNLKEVRKLAMHKRGTRFRQRLAVSAEALKFACPAWLKNIVKACGAQVERTRGKVGNKGREFGRVGQMGLANHS